MSAAPMVSTPAMGQILKSHEVGVIRGVSSRRCSAHLSAKARLVPRSVRLTSPGSFNNTHNRDNSNTNLHTRTALPGLGCTERFRDTRHQGTRMVVLPSCRALGPGRPSWLGPALPVPFSCLPSWEKGGKVTIV